MSLIPPHTVTAWPSASAFVLPLTDHLTKVAETSTYDANEAEHAGTHRAEPRAPSKPIARCSDK